MSLFFSPDEGRQHVLGFLWGKNLLIDTLVDIHAHRRDILGFLSPHLYIVFSLGPGRSEEHTSELQSR